MTEETSLTIFMEALLKDLIGFCFFCQVALEKRSLFCWRRLGSEIELFYAGEMGLSLSGF